MAVKFTYHLKRNVADCFQIELASALLEKIFETLSEKIHNHHVVLFTFVCFFVSYVVEAGHASFTSEFMYQFAFPKKHNVLL